MSKLTPQLLIRYSTLRTNVANSEVLGLDLLKGILGMIDSQPNAPEKVPEFELAVSDFIDGLYDVNQCLFELDHALFKIVEKEEEVDWKVLSGYLANHQQFLILERFGNAMSDEDYWYMVKRSYIMSDFANQEYDFIESFLFGERKNSHFFMSEEERKFFESLPEKVTIYRGCSLEEIESGKFRLSWTLSKKIAEFFANEYRENEGIDCDVVELTVPKTKLFGYVNDRTEEEVIYRHS